VAVERADVEKVVAGAKRVLAQGRQRGVSEWDGKRYDFVCPSPSAYPFQWLWDSAFHAIALLHVDPELAKQEIRCLLQGLQPDGFMPHMILWEKSAHQRAIAEYSIRLAHPFFTATVQPPVLARSVERIFEATGDRAFVREALPSVRRIFDWWADVRDPDEDGLVAIVQPDESGLDASPKYDEAMRIDGTAAPEEVLPALRRSMKRLFRAYEGAGQRREPLLDVFLCEDVMVNSIYADGLRALAHLYRESGMASDAAECEARYRRTLDALVRKCWDPETATFRDLFGAAERPSSVLTFSTLFPLILPDLDPRIAHQLVERHLLNEKEFWLRYPIPSVAATEPTFDPGWRTATTWRGPTWVNVNWYVYWGLRQHGFMDVAAELRRRTIEMVARSGVREFYDPLTGTGQGAHDFGWTTLTLDLIASNDQN
jgi:glycogen debranching enzyme